MLKSREVTTLKKEVEELRDTMRMMRYEEASLSRMLHTAGKPVEPTVQAEAYESPMGQPAAEQLPSGSAQEVEETLAEAPATGEVPEEESVEHQESEDKSEENSIVEFEAEEIQEEALEAEEEVEEAIEAKETVEDALEAIEKDEEVIEEVVTTPVVEARKQPINERRPAIPTDLFAAWFEENEQEQEETPAEVVPVSAKHLENSESSETTEISETSENLDTEAPIAAATISTTSEEQQSMMASHTQEEEQSVQLSKEDERFCRKLERIVNSRMKNPNLNIDIIAAQFGIGRTNFYRKVRELMGMSPNDYLRKCRMERAAEMLCNTDLTVADVCSQVGVPDAQYFSRVFKAYFGTTPSAYREQMSNG
jgi:AraC-like DNA-binding protein